MLGSKQSALNPGYIIGKAGAECYNLPMTSPASAPVVLHADQEHDSLRTAVVLLLTALFFVSYWIVNALLQSEIFGAVRDYAVSLSCVGGLVMSLAISAIAEKGLKRIWHSGRNLTLDDTGILVQLRHQADQHFRWDGHLTRLNWTFKLSGYRRGGREKRLSAKWVCLACQLQQDDQRLIVYSYMPPQKASRWLENDRAQQKFHPLNLATISDSSFSARVKMPIRPEISNEILTGKDGRYWLAECHRWLDGLELTAKDFATLMEEITRRQSGEPL